MRKGGFVAQWMGGGGAAVWDDSANWVAAKLEMWYNANEQFLSMHGLSCLNSM